MLIVAASIKEGCLAEIVALPCGFVKQMCEWSFPRTGAENDPINPIPPISPMPARRGNSCNAAGIEQE
jgi:hypothetical protein